MKTTRDIEKTKNLGSYVLILSVSAVLAYGYFCRVDRPNFEPRLELHNEIVGGTAPSPYRYRVLVPLVEEALTRTLAIIFSVKASFLLSYAMYDLAAIFFLLAVLLSWLRTWFDREQALIGVLFVAGTMPIALQDHYFQPWSLLEAGVFSAALLAMHRRRYWFLVVLVAVASLNRETAVLIPFAFLLTADSNLRSLFGSRSRKDWSPILMFGGLLLTWAAVYGGLRYLLGSASRTYTIQEILARNTTREGLFHAFVNGSLFLGGLWVLALLGFRYAPRFVRRAALIIPFYVVAILVWGRWHEVRLLLPLYPLLVPLGLSFLYLREPKATAA